MEVRRSTPEDADAVAAFLAAHNADRVARRGELVDSLAHPALIAGEFAGVLTYILDGGRCEVLTLHAEPRHSGAGTALIEAVKRARDRGGMHAPVADHDQRQRRRAALLPAPRLPAHQTSTPAPSTTAAHV